jgi:hypothetical protein
LTYPDSTQRGKLAFNWPLLLQAIQGALFVRKQKLSKDNHNLKVKRKRESSKQKKPILAFNLASLATIRLKIQKTSEVNTWW